MRNATVGEGGNQFCVSPQAGSGCPKDVRGVADEGIFSNQGKGVPAIAMGKGDT